MGEAKRKRERPCHCGSGLAYAKCCLENDIKPRHQGFTFTVPEDTLITGMRIGSNGEIELLSGDDAVPIRDVRSTEWRKTTKGLKVKSQAFTADKAYINPEAALSEADYVFGIDTNTIIISGKAIHISCLTCVTKQIAPGDFEGSIQQIMCVDFEDAEHPPERIGWLLAVRSITESIPMAGTVTVLCTDHDMNSLPAINDRSAPYIEDRYLPDGIRLIYASDKGSSIPNKLIKSAHKGASKIAKLLSEGTLEGQKILPFLLNEERELRIRRWKNDANSETFFGQ